MIWRRRNRFALVTVDAEALPKRASEDHVRRLVWGEHEGGTAGVREMCEAADAAGVRLVFFVDACGVYMHGEPFAEVVRWLQGRGHDVQLHTHSEFLPPDFWEIHGFSHRPRLMNQYDTEKARFTIDFFSRFLAELKGEPVRAFRAGSFRWHAGTLQAQAELGIPLSFNNSMRAFVDGVCPHAEETTQPFRWSNGVIEVPMTERRFGQRRGRKAWWGRLAFPSTSRSSEAPWQVLLPYTFGRRLPVLVLLLHSWSLLHWNAAGHGVYRDGRRLEAFERLMRRIAKDYDVITTDEFLTLCAEGRIKTDRTVDVAGVPVPAPRPPKRKRRRKKPGGAAAKKRAGNSAPEEGAKG